MEKRPIIKITRMKESALLLLPISLKDSPVKSVTGIFNIEFLEGFLVPFQCFASALSCSSCVMLLCGKVRDMYRTWKDVRCDLGLRFLCIYCKTGTSIS